MGVIAGNSGRVIGDSPGMVVFGYRKVASCKAQLLIIGLQVNRHIMYNYADTLLTHPLVDLIPTNPHCVVQYHNV